MHVNRIHVPRYCAYEELRAAGDSEIPGPYRHFKIRCDGTCTAVHVPCTCTGTVLVSVRHIGNTGSGTRSSTVNLARLCHLACESVRLCRHYARTWRLCRRSFSAAIMPKLSPESGDGPKSHPSGRLATPLSITCSREPCGAIATGGEFGKIHFKVPQGRVTCTSTRLNRLCTHLRNLESSKS